MFTAITPIIPKLACTLTTGGPQAEPLECVILFNPLPQSYEDSWKRAQGHTDKVAESGSRPSKEEHTVSLKHQNSQTHEHRKRKTI